jgi:hypothetical protein
MLASRYVVAMRLQPIVLIAAWTIGARAASADDTAVPFVSGGATLTTTVHGSDFGLGYGGELSAGWMLSVGRLSSAEPTSGGDLDQFLWLGAYVDGVHDAHVGKTRMSVGPELGYGPVGLDGGLVEQLDGMSRSGVVGRVVVTSAVLALYGRYDKFLDGKPDDGILEFGVLIKLPYMFDHH